MLRNPCYVLFHLYRVKIPPNEPLKENPAIKPHFRPVLPPRKFDRFGYLPILQQMIEKPKSTVLGKPRALILTPTRELAEQLALSIKRYSQYLSFSITAFYGGVKISGQANKLKIH